jgi:hypothetical protein
MERSEIRVRSTKFPHCASLHAGYGLAMQRLGYLAVKPPSITNSAPVTNRASSDNK